MAIFLLIYVVICFIWLFWAGMLTYLLVRFHYPDKVIFPHILAFWVVNVIILVFSVIFILKGDWSSVPAFLGGV